MMKHTGLLLVIGLWILGAIALQARADDPFSDTTTIRQATRTMLQDCKKEFPTEVPGMTINDVDHWAEAQENATAVISTRFKKTQCFANHEAWEKLVQRNEWAGNTASHSDRAPASTKMIDGDKPLSWQGNEPSF